MKKIDTMSLVDDSLFLHQKNKQLEEKMKRDSLIAMRDNTDNTDPLIPYTPEEIEARKIAEAYRKELAEKNEGLKLKKDLIKKYIFQWDMLMRDVRILMISEEKKGHLKFLKDKEPLSYWSLLQKDHPEEYEIERDKFLKGEEEPELTPDQQEKFTILACAIQNQTSGMEVMLSKIHEMIAANRDNSPQFMELIYLLNQYIDKSKEILHHIHTDTFDS